MTFEDNNGVTCFVDDIGVTCWVDDNGNTLCCGDPGEEPRQVVFINFTPP